LLVGEIREDWRIYERLSTSYKRRLRWKNMDYLELIEKLKGVDEVTLLELLEISSEDLVDTFSDKINEHLNKIYRAVSE
jgi:hypothetical protein